VLDSNIQTSVIENVVTRGSVKGISKCNGGVTSLEAWNGVKMFRRKLFRGISVRRITATKCFVET
jgi:hypothetical protein